LEGYRDENEVDWDAEADPYCWMLAWSCEGEVVCELTPPEDIIVYTPCGEVAPKKITIEWFASNPPGHT
jgi:hypothetical protein